MNKRTGIAGGVAAGLVAVGLTAVALGAAPAGAAGWLGCAAGTTPAFAGPYTSYGFGNGELRFQACRTADGDLDRVRTSYVKRAGKPVEVTLGWEWVRPDGTPFVTEGPGGGSHRTYVVGAGQSADFFGPVRYEDGTTDLYALNPGGGYTCLRGAMWTTATGDETLTPKACF